MRVALFVPCYVDQLRPSVGVAALDLLERQGLEVVYPREQTCCGQPLSNAGGADDAARLAARFVEVFDGFDHVVCPSASCVATVVHHFPGLIGATPALERVAERTHELCAFLVEVLGVGSIPGRFPHRVGLHHGCHALRLLRRGPATERMAAAAPDPLRALLEPLEGIRLTQVSRPDECCGFGGSFAVEEEAVSRLMGLDRLADHARGGAEVIASGDVSCLLHLEGLARREGSGVRTLHAAEILLEATA